LWNPIDIVIAAALLTGVSSSHDDGTELPLLYNLRSTSIEAYNLRRSAILAPALLARKARDRTATQIGIALFIERRSQVTLLNAEFMVYASEKSIGGRAQGTSPEAYACFCILLTAICSLIVEYRSRLPADCSAEDWFLFQNSGDFARGRGQVVLNDGKCLSESFSS